ncbi:MAG: nitrous oxide reductase family maturation protein NosD [Nitriliruptorales bacterium]
MGLKAKAIVVVMLLMVVGLVVPAYGAASDVVEPGESIQEAIDAGQPGDTIVVRPGTYAESLEIRKDGIKLLGSGAVLTPPQQPPETACNELPDFIVGICTAGEFEFTEEAVETGRLLPNVTVDGFNIQGFAMGVLGVATENLKVSHNEFERNEIYGAFAIASTGTRFVYNRASDTGFAAYYIGDAPEANALVLGNSAEGGSLGLFYRSAQGTRVVHNVFTGNCAGVLALSEPTPAGDLTLAGNEIFRNNKLCAPEPHHEDEGEEYQQAPEAQQPAEEEPTISGAGIILAGAQHVRVRGNNVWENQPAGEADIAGGIVVLTGPVPDIPPSSILVTRNRSFDNRPADLVWDQTGTAIRFVGNHCATSQPPGLC